MSITYKNLFTQVNNLIESRLKFNTGAPYSSQGSHTDVSPFAIKSTGGDVSLNELVKTIVSIMKETVPARILEGLEVTETSPISSGVIVKAGKGTAGGTVYELSEDTTIPIDMTTGKSVYFINLYPNRIVIEGSAEELTIAKVVVPNPGVSYYIRDTSDGSWDAYIQSFKEYKLYGYNDRFEEDTLALFRDNIGAILADNLIGNIRLNENLKITNTAGTLELDSSEMRLLNNAGDEMMKLNRTGTYFYSETGAELAKFTIDGARVGNIVITKNSIESANFASGALGSGFQINDLGDAEFNNIRARGKLTASVFEKESISSVGGNLLVADSDILDLDMTALDSSTLKITGDTTFSVGDMLRIKDAVDDEWFEVTDTSSAPIYVVTRDKGGIYASNSNPAWTKGTAVINYGASTSGLLYMTASESNSPYLSVLSTGTTPWVSTTTRLRIGNLNGFLDYATEAYGIAVGDDDNYLKYDPVNGLRIKGSITITGGTHIPVTFYQDEEPVSGMQTGDYWVDTNDSNKLYNYQSSSWVLITGGGTGGGITSFAQASIPTSTAAGDLWMDTDDNNKLYRAASSGSTTIEPGKWELVRDAASTTLDTWRHSSDTTRIDGGDIYTGSITADKITVAKLNALTADMGAITAGSITLDMDGFIRGGQTSYAVGEGFFLGYDIETESGGESGALASYKFSVGNATDYMRWNGSRLTMSGIIYASGGEFTGHINATSGSFSGNINATSGDFSGEVTVGAEDNLIIDGPNNCIKVFSDTVSIEADINDDLDWAEDGSTKTAALTAGDYTPSELAAHVQTKMRAAGDADTTVTYSSTTRKITIANSTLTTLVMKFSTGTNNSTSCTQALGFLLTADLSGALTYTATYPCALRVLIGKLS